MRLYYIIPIIFLLLACKKNNQVQTDLSDNSKPNIIFLLSDDHRWSALGYAGNTIIQTPNMDELASEGVFFDNSFVATSICSASRASILSGQYARRHKIWDFSTHFSKKAFSQTYPVLLKENGYYTGFIGKYGVGSKKDMPQNNFDFWKGFPGQGQYWHKDDNGNDKHLTHIMGEQALEFLDKIPDNQPFCLSVSFKAPHVQDGHPKQFLYDSAYQDLYQDIIIPYPETADSCFWAMYPDFFKNNNEARHRWLIRFSTPELYQHSVKGYYRLIYGVDQVIGKIRNKLEQMDLHNNTIIMLTGDNGFYLAEHGMAGKWYGHEESIRVPLIIYDPRFTDEIKGNRRNEMVLNIDIAPTILDFAGLNIPDQMQGKSLLPLITNTDTIKWRSHFLYEHLFDHKKIPMSEGIVGKRYKLLRYINQDPAYEEFYDLDNDPNEIDNKVDDPAYQDVLNQQRKLLNHLIEIAK